MDYAETTKWLDSLIANQKQARKIQDLNSQVSAIIVSPTDLESRSILMYKGIELVADTIGEALTEEYEKNADRNLYRYTFKYGGFVFVQYRKERIVR